MKPQLPLLREYNIGQKVDVFCFKKDRQIKRKSLTAHKVKRIEKELDRLFDISSCCCKLSVLRCENFAVKKIVKQGT